MPHDPASNRVFQLSAPGASALAVVRLTGPNTTAFLLEHFSRQVHPGRCVHGELRDEEGVLDDPVIVLHADGQAADINIHGSAWIARSVVALAEGQGFVPTTAEEIDAHRMTAVDADDTLDAEVKLALPNVATALAARTLLAQPNSWRHLLASLSDVTPTTLQIILADYSLIHLLHPPTVAIVGLPNAGKSTLANQLFGTDRSIVSPIPGTTRDWVGERANLDGLIVTLVDTPGLRVSDDPIEQQAIRQSVAPIAQADLILLLLDASRPTADQSHLITRFPSALRIQNKWDAHLDEWATPDDQIRICARSGDGISHFVSAVHRHFGVGIRAEDAPKVWTERQRRIVEQASAEPSILRTIFDQS